MRGAKTELEEAGLETDNMAESTSTLQAKLKALTHGKVDIMLDADTFKSTTQILREMSDAWEDMTDIERASALELMGGKRQANILASVIKNFDTVESVITTSAESAGSALAENEKYLDSIQGKIDQFNNSLQTFWMKTLDSGMIKGIIDIGKAAIDTAGFIGLIPTALVGVVSYFTIIKKNNPATIFKDLSAQMYNYGLALNRIKNIQSAGLNQTGLSTEEFNTQYINAYAAAVSNLTAKQQAAALASAGLTREQIAEAMAKNGLNKENINLAMSEAQVATAKQQTAAATGIEIISMANKNSLALTENATNWLLKHSTDEVKESLLDEAVAHGILSAKEKESILTAMGVVSSNNMKKASFVGLKQSILQMIKTNPVGFAIGAGTAIISAISAIKNAINKLRDETKQAADEAIKKFEETQSALRNNKTTIEELSDDYAKLSAGVDNLGNNVSLSTSQYERYNEIVNKIADMFPEMVQGYTDEGNAIIKNKGNVEALTEAYKALKQESNNVLLSKAKDIMQTYKYTTEGGFWQWDDSTPDSVKAAKKLDEILKNKDSYNFDIFGQEYRDEVYDDIIGLLSKSGIKRENAESNADYVKRAVKYFPGIVQSIINTWESTVNAAVSNVKPLVSAYLDGSVGYTGLNDKQKATIDSIASSFDEEFFNQFDGDASKMYQAIENIIQNIRTSGIDDDYDLILDVKTSFNGDAISTGKYKEQIDGFISKLNSLQEQGFLNDNDVRYIKLSLGIDEDSSNIDTFTKHVEGLFVNLTDDIKSKISTLNYSDYSIINSEFFDVDDATLYSWDDLISKIERAKVASTKDFSITDYSQSISSISENISTYQEALEKLNSGSFTLVDFLALIEEFPDLAKGVDTSSKSFNGLAKNLKNAIKSSPKNLIKDLKDLRKRLSEAGKATDSIDQLITSLENMPEDSVKSLSDHYATLAENIDKATKAQNELQEAMSEKTNEGYETRGEALEKMKELMGEGKIGSESALWNIAETYGFTYDSAKSINENADALANFISAREEWYKTDDDGNYTFSGTKNFMNDVEAVVASNERLKELGVKWNYNDYTGTLDFDFDNENWDEIIKILSESKELAGLTSEEFQDLLVQVGQFFDINWEDADDLNAYITKIAEGSDDASTKIETMTDAVESYISRVLGKDMDLSSLTKDSIDGIEGCDDAIRRLLENYIDLMSEAQKTIDDLCKPRTTTITANVITGSYSSNIKTTTRVAMAKADGTAHAEGSWGAPQNETDLVGELGPEILVRNGRWTTVGENGAEFTQVKKGDIIFNHKQAEELLKNGHVTGRGKAYASGTAFVGGGGTFAGYEFSGDGDYTKYDVNSLSEAFGDAADSVNEFDETMDWIEIRMEEFDERIGKLSAELENLTTSAEKNAKIDEIVTENQKKYSDALAGAKYYQEYAQKYLEGMNSTLVEAAQNGAIAITEFTKEQDEATVEAIQNYRDYAQKAADLEQQAEETITEIASLAKQAFDNIVEEFDNKLSKNNNKIDRYEAYNSLLETDKGFESEELYGEIIKQNIEKLTIMEQERDALQAEFNKRVESGQLKVESPEWYDAINTIAEIDTEIVNLTTDNKDLQDSINEIRWDKFDLLIKQFQEVSDEAENLLDILEKSDSVDEFGDWTDEGIASLGLYAQKMENAEKQAAHYADAIQKLEEGYKAGRYTLEEYTDKLSELKSGQYDAIKSYHDCKDAIVELNKTRVSAIKDGLQKEIDAHEKLIKKQKELLQAEKDEDDFKKSVAEKEKNISEIQRKLDALEFNNSMSAAAKRKQLKAELAEAEYELEELYADRAYDKQQEALDKELEDFQNTKETEMENWDKYLENVEFVVADSLSMVQENTKVVYDTLTALGQQYSLDITDSLINPWLSGEEAIQNYGAKLNVSLTELASMFGLTVDEFAAKLGLTTEMLVSNLDITVAQMAEKLGLTNEQLSERLGITAADLEDKMDLTIQEFAASMGLTIPTLAEKLGVTISDLAGNLEITMAQFAGKMGMDVEELAGKLGLTSEELSEKLGMTYQELMNPFGLSMSATVEALKKLEEDYKSILDEISDYSIDTVEKVNEAMQKYEEAVKKPVSNESASAPKEEASQPQAQSTSIGSKINAGNARIYADSYGGGGGTQYYSSDPNYIVLDENNGYVLVRHHKLSSGYTGWFKKSDLPKFASGTTSAKKDQFAILDELGEELQLIPGNSGRLEYIKKGTGIIPADVTSNLMSWGELDPQDMLDRNRPQITPSNCVVNTEIQLDCSVGTLVNIEHCDQNTLPDVEKMVNKAFEKHMQTINNGLKRYAR